MAHTEGTPPDLSLADAVTIDDVRAAADRLAGVARRTPVMTSRSLDGAVGAGVFVKCENLQRVGAFKFAARTTPSRASTPTRGAGGC